MKGEVFIAWGENRKLADEVKISLESEDYIVQVGGTEDNPHHSSFYLGFQIMEQLRRASRAIILAQPTDGSPSEATFRPNLMLEWGFLTARILPAYLHVFVIGGKRIDLPSDLQGSWSTEIPLSDEKTMAQKIVETFIDHVRQASVVSLKKLYYLYGIKVSYYDLWRAQSYKLIV